MFKKLTILILPAAVLLLSGCQTMNSVTKVDTRTETREQTMGLDYRDFEESAAYLVSSMISSGAVNHPKGGRYILAISSMLNDTMQRIDTDQLVKKIRVELLRSGKVVVTTAVGINGAEDNMTYSARQLRGNAEFDQSRVARKGRLQAPDLSLSGKIVQRNNTLSSGKTQSDYYFMLSLTDINTGLALWEDETVIGKRGPGKAATW